MKIFFLNNFNNAIISTLSNADETVVSNFILESKKNKDNLKYVIFTDDALALEYKQFLLSQDKTVVTNII